MFLVGQEIFVLAAIDWFIIGSATLSFFAFVLFYIAIFRLVKRNAVLKWLIYIFFMGLLVNLGITAWFMFQNDVVFSLGLYASLTIIFLPMLFYGFLSFLYVVCIFGTYESSIRLRIVRELSEAATAGLTWDELLQRYNDEMILKIRLDRLLVSKELSFDGAYYRVQKKPNVFSMITAISQVFRKLYGLNDPEKI